MRGDVGTYDLKSSTISFRSVLTPLFAMVLIRSKSWRCSEYEIVCSKDDGVEEEEEEEEEEDRRCGVSIISFLGGSCASCVSRLLRSSVGSIIIDESFTTNHCASYIMVMVLLLFFTMW